MSERRTGRSHGVGPDPATNGPEPGNWAARHDLLLFFTLAYLLSWALWPLVILNPTSSPLVPFGPLIAAVVVSLLAGGPKELWALLRQLTRWRVHPIWYLIALLGPLVMAGLAAAIAVATGSPMRRSGAYTDVGAIGFTFLVNDHHRWAFRGGRLARLSPSQVAASPRRHQGRIATRCPLGPVASARANFRPDGTAASAAVRGVGPGTVGDLGMALQQHKRQSAHRDHLPRCHRYGGSVHAAGILQPGLSGRLVDHGRALRRDRDRRGTCRRSETSDEDSSISRA